MKHLTATAAFLLAFTAATFGQNVFSISTGPGENASTQIGISWATGLDVHDSYVLYTEESDADWSRAIKVLPQQQELCTSFQGIPSNRADGEAFFEDAVFTKCGVMLTGLRPDTDYKYTVVDASKTDSPLKSREYHFRTAGASKWSACIISDFHSYPPLPGRLVSAMGMIDRIQEIDPSLDFVFSPGDVVAWGGSYSFWRRLFEEPNFSELMWARVNGNHDNWTKTTTLTGNFDIPHDFFTYTSYYPANGYRGELGICYHFRYGNTLFIMLNTEDMSDKKGEFEEAAQWVRSVVAQARAGEDAPTFIVACMHYEWFVGTNGRTSQYGRWSEVFDEVGMDLAVAGNNHVYVRTQPLYKGEKTDGKRNGTVYIQTTASDNERGRSFADEPLQNAELIEKRWTEGSKSVSAIHMEVSADTISLKLRDRDGNVVDSCTVHAKKH